jgi:hypothetical protein
MSYIGHKKLSPLQKLADRLILLAQTIFSVKTGGQNGETAVFRS